MDDGGQHCGADGNFDGVGAHQVQHLLDDGAEGARIGEDAEEQDRENEHDAGGGHGADAGGTGDHFAQALEVGHKIHDAGGIFRVGDKEETGDDAGDHGNRDKGYQRGCLFGHNQNQHEHHSQKAKKC